MSEGQGAVLKATSVEVDIVAGSPGKGFQAKNSDGKTVIGATGYGSNHRVACSNGRKDEPNEPALHANLATPPLTPPREVPLKEPPVNVNRNNVSDSAHVKASQFSTTVRQGGVVSNGIVSGDHSHRQNGIPGYVPASHGVDSEPPALVVGMNDDSQEEHKDQEGVAYGKEADVILRKEPQSHSQDRTAWSTVEKTGSKGSRRVKEQGDYSSADGDAISGDDEDVEGMDLVLVEEDTDEDKATLADSQHGRQSNGRVVKTMEAESSTSSSYPQPSSTPNENGRIVALLPAGGTAGTLPFSREGSSGKREGEHVSTGGGGHSDDLAHEARNFSRSGVGYSNEVDHRSTNGIANHQGGIISSGCADKEASAAIPATTTGQQLGSHNNGGSKGDGDGKGEGVVGMEEVYSRKVAKVKQFFSTIQHCANNMGVDVGEQVQELIHAVLNGTATAEEFHQEIQIVTNYPLKTFAISFIRENVKYLQAELKESAQVLSDILGTVPSSSSTVALTPQADEDDELPVLPFSSKSISLPTIRPGASIIHSSINSSPSSISSTSASSKLPPPAATPSSLVSSSVTAVSIVPSSALQTPGSSSSNISRSFPSSQSAASSPLLTQVSSPNLTRSTAVMQVRSLPPLSAAVAMMTPVDEGGAEQGNSVFGSRKRLRKLSADKGTTTISESQSLSSDKANIMAWPKRIRSEVNEGVVIVNNPRPVAVSYPHPPPPPPPTTHIVSAPPPTRPSSADKQTAAFSPSFIPPQEHHGNRRRGNLLSEDWGLLDKMLNSVQGMVDRTRQSMAALKDRVQSTHLEMERKEVDHDHIIQQRVAEAVEKTRRQANEERQRLLVEANKQVRDAVSAVRAEMEQKFQQAQSTAIQEALNNQSNSKENCWNCGRRASETCSGCNKARYCGEFCQHKDWLSHMHQCASGLPGQQQPQQQAAPEEAIYTASSREQSRPQLQHHHQVAVAIPAPTELAMATPSRNLVAASHHQRAVAIPVSLINRPQDRSTMRMSHPEIIIKSEKS